MAEHFPEEEVVVSSILTRGTKKFQASPMENSLALGLRCFESDMLEASQIMHGAHVALHLFADSSSRFKLCS